MRISRDFSVCTAMPPNRRLTSQEIMVLEKSYSANNYSPLPVVFAHAKGCTITDPEGKTYIDFMAAYSAVNQGHCHPALVQAMKTQLEHCTLSSRAFYNDRFGTYCEFITKLFGYDRVLPTNTGTEAVETAIKLARKWAYCKKGVASDQAIIIGCEDNFHGRTYGSISLSTDPDSYGNYGPLLPGIEVVPYNNIEALDQCFRSKGSRIAAFLVEPIQGEAGVIVPSPGYLKSVSELCKQHNVLFIADEIQSGLGRAGKLLAVDYDNVRPDIITLGKALSGGLYPISAVLADNSVMSVITPGTHGSTFGGNPLASVLGIESLKILINEKMSENSYDMGLVLREELQHLQKKQPIIKAVRGLGLMNAIDVEQTSVPDAAYKVSKECLTRGLLVKPTHGHTLRLTPPLVITREEILKAVFILEESCLAVTASYSQ